MAAPAASATSRYINPGTTKVYLVDTIANKNAPTRAELDDGLDVSEQIASVSGWLVSGAAVETPDLASEFTSNIPGRTNAAESSIEYWADKTGQDLRDRSERNTNLFVVWMDGGDVAGYLMDIFPVRVLSQGKTRSVEGTDAARVPVQYSITSVPAENVEIPA